MATAQ